MAAHKLGVFGLLMLAILWIGVADYGKEVIIASAPPMYVPCHGMQAGLF